MAMKAIGRCHQLVTSTCVAIALIGLMLVTFEYLLYLFLTPSRPSSEERFEATLPGRPFANVLGQVAPSQMCYAIVLLAALYYAKTGIVFRCHVGWLAVIQYVILLGMCLPILWVFVTTDWNNPHAELSYWLTLPVGLLGVPTLGFAIDLAMRPYPSWKGYAMKTGAEAIFIPIWLSLWIVIELLLGFYWI
jgi:hypothetical protein